MKKYFFVLLTAISVAAIATSADFSNAAKIPLQKKVIRDTIPDTSGNKHDTAMKDSSRMIHL